MSTLYVDGRGMELTVAGETLQLVGPGREKRTFPLRLLDRLVLQGGVRITTNLLARLGAHGVAVVVLNPRQPEQAVRLHPLSLVEVTRRLAQYQRYRDEAWRAAWSRRLVAAKLKAQQRVLRRAAATRGDLSRELSEAWRSIERSRERLRAEPPPSPARILGLEGAAAAAYFRAYSRLFAPALGMRGRNRRPPRDPVNVCLSLSYTILHAQLTGELIACGLDPYLGFYHEPAHGRESLACDLVEILRPRVEAWVWEMFRKRRLRPEHFHRRAGRCLIGKAGRRIFYEEFEYLMEPLARRCRRLARLAWRAVTAGNPAPASGGGKEEILFEETTLS